MSSSSRKKSKEKIEEAIDAWVTLDHLFKSERPDVRNFLITQLYYWSDDDVDFFLPQLCTLVAVRKGDLSTDLEIFLLHKCQETIHFALKCYWMLHAIQYHALYDYQKQRCDDIRNKLEMIVVNDKLPHGMVTKLPRAIREQNTHRTDRSPHGEYNSSTKTRKNSWGLKKPKKKTLTEMLKKRKKNRNKNKDNHSNNNKDHKNRNKHRNHNNNNNNSNLNSKSNTTSAIGTSNSSSTTTTKSNSSTTSSANLNNSGAHSPVSLNSNNTTNVTNNNSNNNANNSEDSYNTSNSSVTNSHNVQSTNSVNSNTNTITSTGNRDIIGGNTNNKILNKAGAAACLVNINPKNRKFNNEAANDRQSFSQSHSSRSKSDSKTPPTHRAPKPPTSIANIATNPNTATANTSSNGPRSLGLPKPNNRRRSASPNRAGSSHGNPLPPPRQRAPTVPEQEQKTESTLVKHKNKLITKLRTSINIGSHNIQYLKKQRRCTYFNAELDFAHFLEGISAALEQCERPQRKALLEENVKYANKCLPRGLYLPIAHTASEPHKSLLRIVPNTSKCLASKQKVPFMIFCEVKKHEYPTSSPDIIEELVESADAALLSGSGTYVLIDSVLKKANENDDKKKEQASNDHNSKPPNTRRLSAAFKQKIGQITHKMEHEEKHNAPLINHSYTMPLPKQRNTTEEKLMQSHLKQLTLLEPKDTDKAFKKKLQEKHALVASTSTGDLPLFHRPLDPKMSKSDPILEDNATDRQVHGVAQSEPQTPRSESVSSSSYTENDVHARTEPNSIEHDTNDNNNLTINLNGNINETESSQQNTTPSPSLSTKSNPVRGSKGKMAPSLMRRDSKDGTNANNNEKEKNSQGNDETTVANGKSSTEKPQLNGNSNHKNHHHHNNHKHQHNHNHNHRHHHHHHHHHKHGKGHHHHHLRHIRGKSLRWQDPFGEPWEKRKERFYKASPFKCPNWDLQSLIFKSGEDMRQEQLAMQFIQLFDTIFRNANLPLQLRPYSVIVSSPASGFVETIPNAVSISGLKHSIKNFVSLRRFFEQFYGPPGSPSFQNAQKNFVESMAAYSLVCYFLQIKDRHNGNILLDSEGRIVHIDFDFILSNSPGGNINFESSPFKLTEEFIEVMGGERDSESFNYFQVLMIRGFGEIRNHWQKFVLLVEIMHEGAPMPCFHGGPTLLDALKARFVKNMNQTKLVEHVCQLIEESSCNWRTIQYDRFQKITNDIL